MLTPDTAAPDTVILWSNLPQFAQDADEATGYQFLTWLDGICSQLQNIDDLIRDSTAGPGWSSVLDVTRCPTYALPWLAQWVGTRFNGTTASSDASMRYQLSTWPNINRGQLGYLYASLTPLTAGGTLNIIERYPTPYSILMNVTLGTGFATYADLTAAFSSYGEIISAFSTYSGITAAAPIDLENAFTAAAQSEIPAGVNLVITFL